MRVRRNDLVRVMTGAERGKEGKVLSVDAHSGRVLIEGVNKTWKHLRRSQQHPHGARIQKESPVHISNVKVVCQACSKPTRIVGKKLEDGGKARVCRKCGQAVTAEA
jgi:large subunit ribosomal protein L24